MKEDALRGFLTRLGIRVEGRNTKRGQPGKVWLNFRCPVAPYHPKHNFQADRSPSAGAVSDVSGRASRWACHACKSHGTVHDLVRSLAHYEGRVGVDYEKLAAEAIDVEFTGLSEVQWGQDLHGFEPPPEPLVEEMYDGFWPHAWDVPEARAYLQRRRISAATAYSLELLFQGNDAEKPVERNRILFPVRDRQGRLYGWSGRAIYDHQKPKIYDAELPKRHLILGAERWKDGLPLMLVEGLFAFARQVENGIEERANVGALLGSAMTPEKAEIIRTHGEPTYLLMDGDEAGDACIFGPIKDGRREIEHSAIALLHKYVPLFIPTFPDEVTDPDDLTREEALDILDNTPRFGLTPEEAKFFS